MVPDDESDGIPVARSQQLCERLKRSVRNPDIVVFEPRQQLMKPALAATSPFVPQILVGMVRPPCHGGECTQSRDPDLRVLVCDALQYQVDRADVVFVCHLGEREEGGASPLRIGMPQKRGHHFQKLFITTTASLLEALGRRRLDLALGIVEAQHEESDRVLVALTRALRECIEVRPGPFEFGTPAAASAQGVKKDGHCVRGAASGASEAIEA
mmetsp:Transcript_39280/g.108289  ORF Transcript_39280/g.108289 Transcript_39280/m.108289 type:complete len:213 (+) Transcript_39280:951-1589(+)